MKALKISGAVLLVLALLLSLGTLSAAAQGATGTGPMNASFIDNQAHSIPAGSSVWYQFTYTGTSTEPHPITTIKLVNGYNSGLRFEVWAPDQINDMVDNKPLGRSNVLNVDCDTGQPSAQGQCQSTDLIWLGAFGTNDNYFVQVFNDNTSDTQALLTISGDGVSVGQPVTSAATPNAQAAATTNTDDPGKATAIDSQPHSIPANSSIWYSFDYNVSTQTGDHPIVTLDLMNGTALGLSFEVYAPNDLNNWWQNAPTGRSQAINVMCSSGDATPPSTCQSADQTWNGAFGVSGTYYVRVTNNQSNAVNYSLTMTSQ